MARLFALLVLSFLSASHLLAQEGVDVNPDPNPSAPVTDSPTLWILFAVVLLAALFLLRRRAKPRRT